MLGTTEPVGLESKRKASDSGHTLGTKLGCVAPLVSTLRLSCRDEWCCADECSFGAYWLHLCLEEEIGAPQSARGCRCRVRWQGAISGSAQLQIGIGEVRLHLCPEMISSGT